MLPVLAMLVVVNVWTILLFAHDKARARAGGRRVPEAHLLRLALVGGTPGALLARRWLRHKSRKQPFSSRLRVIAIGQAALLVLGLLLAARG
ncbi:DUF1294 domain-containing protein [Sphingomonas parva]|uniref:DUF1294 domain-containing protein n=1 Tax=Sphingomonas parva TaxID=2555898 RepID=A0A4Y8ZVE2_9SPHN|nr:DUF1294 domain-containing protein [Sphingomonas parva]TFI59105.1 DUF1294 domain-containing protein [Sphingomonas parva]